MSAKNSMMKTADLVSLGHGLYALPLWQRKSERTWSRLWEMKPNEKTVFFEFRLCRVIN